MGIFSKILGGLETVAGVALIATGVGVLAGAMMVASGLGAMGLIGGSVGKFMKSGVGMGLMAAVSLGGAAYSMFGQTALQAGETAANATVEASAPGAAATTGAAAGEDAAAATGKSFLDSTNATQEVAAMATDPNIPAVGGASRAAVTAGNAETLAPTNANAAGAAAQATAGDTAAVKPLASEAQSTTNPGSVAGANASAPPTGAAGAPPQQGYTPPDTSTTSAEDVLPAEKGGILQQALNVVDKHPGLATVGGNLIGGVGQGIANKQATEDMIRAQQWGNMQWQQPGQIASLQNAAAKPITVPQGYLQRAQAVRGMVSGNSGIQPLPISSPGGPLAPPPAPVGH